MTGGNWIRLRLADLKNVMTRWQKDLAGKGWNSNYLNNHDQARQVSRFGDDGRYRLESAKMLATFLHMLQGTPYIYQGEEIGMTNVAFESINDYNDVETLNIYHELVDERGSDPRDALRLIHARSRDNARTPMQWNSSPQAGFTSGTPWLKVNPNYPEINTADALRDPNSVFHYYQKLIKLRKSVPAVVYGSYDLILPDHQQIYAFTRNLENESLLVILNFSGEQVLFEWPEDWGYARQELMIANYPVAQGKVIRKIMLRPYEARVYRCE